MRTINPYETQEPYLWAGNYLLFGGKVVGFIEYEDRADTRERWRCFFLVDNQGARTESVQFARSFTQAGVMLRLQEWLEDMILRRSAALDIFTATVLEFPKNSPRSP